MLVILRDCDDEIQLRIRDAVLLLRDRLLRDALVAHLLNPDTMEQYFKTLKNNHVRFITDGVCWPLARNLLVFFTYKKSGKILLAYRLPDAHFFKTLHYTATGLLGQIIIEIPSQVRSLNIVGKNSIYNYHLNVSISDFSKQS